MKIKLHSIKRFIRKHYIISALALILIVFVGYKMFGSSNNNSQVFTVKVADVVQKVIVTGNTKAVHAVELGFETAGKVSSVSADVGTRVYAGQTLVSLDSSETYADVLKAKANLVSEQARLDEIKKGTRPEEITIAEADVENAKNTMTTKMLDSFVKSDNAIYNNVDQFFSNPRTANPQFNLNTSDSQLKTDIVNDRMRVEDVLSAWKNNTADISTAGIAKVKTNLGIINTFVQKVATVVNAQTTGGGVTQATIDGYKASMSNAREDMTTAMNSIATAEGGLISAQNTLSLKKVGSTPETIAAEQALVMQNDAAVKSAEAKLGKTTLRSPISGVVTKQDAKVGEIVTSGKVVVSVISDNDLEIEANVSEISIGKVAMGNPVVMNFDAFPNSTFDGTVAKIEPAETIIDGVVNYKVTVAFAKTYPEIKSGLTAKLEIMTATKVGVLIVPQYAIVKTDAGVFVAKQIGETFTNVPVTLGLVGQDGSVEVLSGLSVGDVIQAIAPAK